MKDKDEPAHESHGVIRISRIQSSGTRLFRSPVKSHAFMELSIGTATVGESHGDRWPRAHKRLIKVAMSPIQFAELLTAGDFNDGVPCTITWHDGRQFEDPPAETDDLEPVVVAADASYKEGIDRIRSAIERLDSSTPLSAKSRRDILMDLNVALGRIEGEGRKFWREQLHEKAEGLRTRVVAEVSGAAELFLRNIGLDALREKAARLLPTYEPPKLPEDRE